MSEQVGREELLKHLHAAFAEFNAMLDSLSEPILDQPGMNGEWSVKDVLAHFIAHEQRAIEEIRWAQRGLRLEIDHNANDVFNAEAVLRSTHQGIAEIRGSWEKSFRDVVQTVESLATEDFDPGSSLCHVLDDTIDGALANNTYNHYLHHLAAIRSSLDDAP